MSKRRRCWEESVLEEAASPDALAGRSEAGGGFRRSSLSIDGDIYIYCTIGRWKERLGVVCSPQNIKLVGVLHKEVGLVWDHLGHQASSVEPTKMVPVLVK